MKKSRTTVGIAASLVLSLGLLLPLPARATEPADGVQGEGAYQDTQEEETYQDTKSGDNSLSVLSISPGTLSPDFKYSVVNYKASVGADVTRIDVDAKTSNAAAKILSITGNEDLKEGENTISISVEAENGAPVTYRIVVTRGGEPQSGEGESAAQGESQGQDSSPEGQGEGAQTEGAEGIVLNGHTFNLGDTVPEDQMQKGFSVAEINCKGQKVQALKSDKIPSLALVYLTTPSTEVKNTLAVYEEGSGDIYPFRKVKIGKNYVILLNPPAEAEAPASYAQGTSKIGKFEDVPVFSKEGNEFSLVYAASSQGNVGWYQYDTVEKSFQRFVQEEGGGSDLEEDTEAASAQMQGLRNAYKDLEKQYNHKKDSSRKTISVLLFLLAVLVLVIINLLLHKRRIDRELDDWEDEKEIEDGFHAENAPPARANRKKGLRKDAKPKEKEAEGRRTRKAWEEPKKDTGYAPAPSRKKRCPAREEEMEQKDPWQEVDPVFAELSPRSKKRIQEKDDWDQKSLDYEKADWDQHAPSTEKGDWDEPKPKRELNETAELRLDDDFEVIDLEDL